jgi:hypothetical protein
MSSVFRKSWFVILVIPLLLAACMGKPASEDPSAAYTKIWEAVASAQTMTAMAVSPTPSLTNTPVFTPTLQATNSPQVTATSTKPTATSTTSAPPQTGINPEACDKADFIGDVTIPDYAVVPAETSFWKTWEIKNLGPCTWTRDYSLVYNSISDGGSGGVFTPPAKVKFPNQVLPGENLDISVEITSPKKPGTYQVYFLLKNDKGYNIPLINVNAYLLWVIFVVK